MHIVILVKYSAAIMRKLLKRLDRFLGEVYFKSIVVSEIRANDCVPNCSMGQ